MAGESATTRPIGFSKDGKFFAYVEYVMQDGSGFTIATVKFLDVAKNAYADKAVTVRDENEMADLYKTREKALTKAAPILAKLKILKNNSEFLVSRQITDTDVAQNKDMRHKAEFSTYRNMLSGGQLSLSLDLKKGKSDLCISEVEPKMLKLSLKRADGKVVILQEDKELPKSRGCAYDYVIQDVIIKEDSRKEAVVLVNVVTNGFEGPSTETIAITGMLE